MPVASCRVCGASLYERPLLRYEDMPRVAQFLPDKAGLAADRGMTLDVRQCSGCGLVQLSNDPVPYFRDVIRAAAVSPEMTEFRRVQFGDFARRFGLAGRKVVEIGCGRGEFLAIAAQCGMEVHGIEHAEDSVNECRRRGLRVSAGYPGSPSVPLPGAPFDGFLMLNFLEHFPDPNAGLRAVAGALADGGVGLVEVPSFDMIVREALFSEFTTDHLLYFTEATLRTALALNGFEALECREVWHGYILSAVARKRGVLDVSRFEERRARLRAELDAYVRRFPPGRVAAWGAGHQALAVLALAGLAGRIRYVVDSAPFKQGRYTPATHVPIVSPETLASDPVDAVIVMAASYSDEVAGIVRKRFGSALTIAILRECGLEERP